MKKYITVNIIFCKLNKNDEPLKSKIIGMYDNTGYRSYVDVPLNIFDNKE